MSKDRAADFHFLRPRNAGARFGDFNGFVEGNGTGRACQAGDNRRRLPDRVRPTLRHVPANQTCRDAGCAFPQVMQNKMHLKWKIKLYLYGYEHDF